MFEIDQLLKNKKFNKNIFFKIEMIKLTDMLEKELIVRISTDSPFKGFLLTTQLPGEFIETKGFRKPNG